MKMHKSLVFVFSITISPKLASGCSRLVWISNLEISLLGNVLYAKPIHSKRLVGCMGNHVHLCIRLKPGQSPIINDVLLHIVFLLVY